MASAKSPPAATQPTGACPRLESCALFPKLSAAPVLAVWQTCYCRARFESCACFRLAVEGHPVPATLLPNGNELAAELFPDAGT